MAAGGAGAFYACRIGERGQCDVASTAEYCHDGEDFKCPTGFYFDASSGKNTLGDCLTSPAGEECSGSATATTCPDGY